MQRWGLRQKRRLATNCWCLLRRRNWGRAGKTPGFSPHRQSRLQRALEEMKHAQRASFIPRHGPRAKGKMGQPVGELVAITRRAVRTTVHLPTPIHCHQLPESLRENRFLQRVRAPVGVRKRTMPGVVDVCARIELSRKIRIEVRIRGPETRVLR